MKVGVLNIQGAVSEHLNLLEKCGVEGVPLKGKGELAKVKALIIPGGESTTIGRLIKKFHLDREIIEMHKAGKPIWGTCAGMVLLAREIEGENPHLGLMDIKVKRNAFGRQRESFEEELVIKILGKEPFMGLFIRAPIVTRTGLGVEIISTFQDQVVGVREGKLLATSFHPELTEDLRFHKYFLKMAGAGPSQGCHGDGSCGFSNGR
ncbi:MAG: pyridoxal 5'-phosphate synthase glutaminase subunit PdxT [Candidatus Syntrophonatronum acetioxidans]|uniref:Pyridoxal 5'-phosphate synthase subunit PdxT n=1 Tax=Candidatus Syntrophonatronum acetioxidans TaxID=1795816 RepID=A0A424YB42_9FIRM|nr:MAG: pyridoxal 5'-phosphate synthase glutaminase subunit PdxT [Candidatus Syntrophonatronum acetioxidans]